MIERAGTRGAPTLGLVPDNSKTVYNLALVTERIGDYPAPLTSYRRAVAMGGIKPELSRARQRAEVLRRTLATGTTTPQGINHAN